MKKILSNKRAILALVALLTLSAGVVAQFRINDVIKTLGVGAAVRQFGGEINRAFNRLTGHQDTPEVTTKVVPILSVAIIRGDNAVGAAQVSGPKHLVNQVEAVAQPETNIFGEIRIRAFIPVSSRNVIQDLRRVEGVAVTGIVDLRL